MSALTPCLRSDLRFVERAHLGATSYVVKDPVAHRYFRFGSTDVGVMRRFDGRHTPAEIAAGLEASGLAVSADAIEQFARQLADLGLLERALADRSMHQMERLRTDRREHRRRPLFRGELLRMRWSFGDPDMLLDRLLPRLRWMFTCSFIVFSLLAFLFYAGVIATHWNALGAAVWEAYAPANLTLGRVLTLWLTAGVVILVHELGHGLTCKHFGGEVRELGVMLLYFQPAFYCDVSDAWTFPDRRARLWVTAAGSWIELLVTALATFVWLIVAPGTFVANIMVAVMLIGGLTTIFGNMNPLLPLDGYFALADWLEIPNLRGRAMAHLAWWIQARWFGMELCEPAATASERRVFLIYGVLASSYVAGLFMLLSLFALGWMHLVFGGIGVAAAIALLALVLRPRITAWARVVGLAIRARLADWRRPRWRGGVVIGLAALLASLFLPSTLTTHGRFEVFPTASFTVMAPAAGVVAQVFVWEGARVAAGAPVLRLVDRELDESLLAQTRAVDSCAITEARARAAGRAAEAERLSLDREAGAARLVGLERRVERLTARAVMAGIVVTPRPEDLVGRRFGDGDSLLALASVDSVEARVSLDRGGATRVRAGQVAHLVSYADADAPWTARVSAVSVAATKVGPVEARIRRAVETGWRPGVTGEAKVELVRSTVLGVIWWKARQLVRRDLWL